MSMKLDIVSDTICPWCYVGKRHLEAALPILRAEGYAFELRWRPFQLNPDMPRAGSDRRVYRSAKFGSWERSQALDAQVVTAAAAVGLEFRYDLMLMTPNTLASHVLVELASEDGGELLQGEIVERLFSSYFTRGQNVGDPDVLADIGAELGMDRGRVVAAIADPERSEAVLLDETSMRRLNLTSAPSFVLDGHYVFSGAQPASVMIQLLGKASARFAAEGASGAVMCEP
jgi:predicted DsbA family dithiol-disulfide isomerase